MFHYGTRRRTALAGLAVLGVLVAGCAHATQSAPKPSSAPAIKGTTYPDVERQLIDAVNRQRDGGDLKALVRHTQLATKARSWAAAMASGACGRDAKRTPRVCHSKLSDGISAKWKKLGENVSKASPRSNIDAVVKKFAAENRKNILDPTFDHVGVGVAYVGKHVYVVEVFMNLDNAGSVGATVSSVPRTTAPPTTTKPPAPPTGENVGSGGGGASETPETTAPRPTVAPSPTSVTAPPTTSPAPKPTGGKYTVEQVLTVAYAAGFRSEAQLLAVAAIAVSESSLVVKQRNWHPEYGCRPASAVLGVALPAGACSGQPNRQTHSDRGIVQISSHWWPQYTDAQTDDPATAMKILFTISKSGTDFTPWDAYKSGSAQSHYDRGVNGWPALRPIVRAFLA